MPLICSRQHICLPACLPARPSICPSICTVSRLLLCLCVCLSQHAHLPACQHACHDNAGIHSRLVAQAPCCHLLLAVDIANKCTHISCYFSFCDWLGGSCCKQRLLHVGQTEVTLTTCFAAFSSTPAVFSSLWSRSGHARTKGQTPYSTS